MTKFPCMLVFTGKHGSQFFWCSNANELGDAALYVLWLRWHSGYYFAEPEDEDDDTFQLPSMDRESINKLPEGKVKEAALEEWNVYDENVKYREKIEHENKQVESALSNRDGVLAYRILAARRNYEYEGMEIEYPDEVKLPKGNLLKIKDKSGYFL